MLEWATTWKRAVVEMGSGEKAKRPGLEQVVVEKAGVGNKKNPTVDDPVNVLPGIGSETLSKLMDMRGTASRRGLQVPFDRIATGAALPSRRTPACLHFSSFKH